MTRVVTKISAVGTRGEAKGREFIAKPDSSGRFVLNKKASTPTDGNKTNKAKNKVYVKTLTEAVELLESGDYLINVVCDAGTRALRQYSAIRIDYV